MLRGLKDIKQRAEEKASFDGEGAFLKLKDKESIKLRFLQELDEESPNYDERRGLITVVEEHVSPKNFRRRAVCTLEQDQRCWACEQRSIPDIGKKWRSKMRFYANVVVRGTDGADDKVKVLAQGFSKQNVGSALIAFAEEYQTVTGQDYKLTRTGAGMNDTTYGMIPLASKALSKDDAQREIIDVSQFIQYIKYEDQAEYYTSSDDSTAEKKDW